MPSVEAEKYESSNSYPCTLSNLSSETNSHTINPSFYLNNVVMHMVLDGFAETAEI
jgi:hypothetical protein